MSHPIALVTGATSGIGKATAKRLAAQGAIVTLTGRRVAEGDQVVEEIKRAGGQAMFIASDIRDEASVQRLVETVVARHGRLDWLAHSAGAALEAKRFAESDSGVFREMVDINLIGTYNIMKHAIRQMQTQSRGAIVNVSSIAGVKGSPTFGAYAATKFGVIGMTKTAALEYAAHGIRINAVAPGAIRTEPVEQLFSAGQLDEASLAAAHPLQRIGEPEEVAAGIAWLLSDASAFVTGHVLSIDGGLHAL